MAVDHHGGSDRQRVPYNGRYEDQPAAVLVLAPLFGSGVWITVGYLLNALL